MTGTQEDAVWKDIDKSGVLLELKIASLIEELEEWEVSVNPSYMDADENKGRTLDPCANRVCDLKGKTFPYDVTFEAEVFIECKKVPGNSWTFFLPKKPVSTMECEMDWWTDASGRTSRYSSPFGQALRETVVPEATVELYHETILDRKQSNGQVNNLYEASVTLAKARDSMRREERDLEETGEDREIYVDELMDKGSVSPDGYLSKTASLFEDVSSQIPLIVFEGSLYIAEPESRRLEPAHFVRLCVDYRSSQYRIFSQPVDICTPECFPKYLKAIGKAVDQFKHDAFSLDFSTATKDVGETFDRSKTWFENRYLDVFDEVQSWIADRMKKERFVS